MDGNFDETFVAEWCALEHNVDIWFLFELMGRLGFDGFSERADRLAKSIIRGLWVEDEGRFRQGFIQPTMTTQRRWISLPGADCLLPILMLRKRLSAENIWGVFIWYEETTGYTPYHPDYGYSGHSRGVWVEGTAGVALFERKLGNELNAVNLVAAMAPLFNEYGYRDSCDNLA